MLHLIPVLQSNKCVFVCVWGKGRETQQSELIGVILEVHRSLRVRENCSAQWCTNRSDATFCSHGLQSLTVCSCLYSSQHSKMEETTEQEGGAGEALWGRGEAASQAAAGGAAGAGAAAAGGVHHQEGEPAGAAQTAAGASQIAASGPGQSLAVPFEEYTMPVLSSANEIHGTLQHEDIGSELMTGSSFHCSEEEKHPGQSMPKWASLLQGPESFSSDTAELALVPARITAEALNSWASFYSQK